jgi:hypothetical protein
MGHIQNPVAFVPPFIDSATNATGFARSGPRAGARAPPQEAAHV